MEYSDDEIVFFKTLNLLDPRLQTLDNTEYRFYITKENLKEMFLFSHDHLKINTSLSNTLFYDL